MPDRTTDSLRASAHVADSRASEGSGRLGSKPWVFPERSQALVLITVAGLLFRLALLYLVRHSPIFADELDYQGIAAAIVGRHQVLLHGLPTAFRPIGEPLLIAAVFEVVGPHILAVKFVQELLLTSLPWLGWKLARAVGLSLRNANIAALLIAFHPALAFATSTVYPTALTTVLLTAGIVYGGAALRRAALGTGVLSAACVGLAGLFTTVFIPLPALMALYAAWRRRVSLAMAFCLLGLAPSAIWVARNAAVMHAWTVGTNGGMNLYLGANDEATPRSGNWVAEPAVDGGELVKDHVLQQRAVQWIHQHPSRWAELCLARGLLVVDSIGKPKTSGAPTGLGVKVVGLLLLPLILAGIAGLVLFVREPEAAISMMALALVILSSATTIAKPRFRLPCDPVLMVFAVGTWQRLASARGRGLVQDDQPSTAHF